MRLLAGFALLALMAVTAPAARAGLPPMPNATIPNHVVLVGRGPAGADSASGHCTVVVRDFANNPVPSAVVVFDVSACGDMALATDQHDPRLFVNCAMRWVSAVTDANGIARFTVIGAGVPGASSLPGCFKVYGDGVLFGYPRLAVLERDGAPGLSLADFSLWAADFFADTQAMRADLNGDGSVSLIDLSTWAAAYFNGANVEAVGPLCP